uniref:Pectin acetylesterase n=1 Tax=Aegilops tauschii TaxID=37682 RepID=M8BY37_AEGTA
MAATTKPLLHQEPEERQHRSAANSACRLAVASAVLIVLLMAAFGHLRTRLFLSLPDPVEVELILVAGATEKGAVCLDGTPAGYHLQRGSGSGSNNWLIHLEGAGWCGTIKECSDRKMSMFGSSNFMKPIPFAGAGILDNDQQLNPDFYNWNKVYVRNCDGASFSGDAEGQAQDGTTLYFKGLHIYEAVIDELMEKGLTNATKNVQKVLPKDCLAKKDPTECFLSVELIKSINTPMFILNSGYDSWQIRNVLVPDPSDPDKSWLSCKDDMSNCNSTQVEVFDGFMDTMVDALKVVEDKEDWGLFIDSCFTHCQSIFGLSWNSAISPRLGNKIYFDYQFVKQTIAEVVGDWYHGRSQGVKEIDCEYPCNPTCNSLLPT